MLGTARPSCIVCNKFGARRPSGAKIIAYDKLHMKPHHNANLFNLADWIVGIIQQNHFRSAVDFVCQLLCIKFPISTRNDAAVLLALHKQTIGNRR